MQRGLVLLKNSFGRFAVDQIPIFGGKEDPCLILCTIILPVTPKPTLTVKTWVSCGNLSPGSPLSQWPYPQGHYRLSGASTRFDLQGLIYTSTHLLVLHCGCPVATKLACSSGLLSQPVTSTTVPAIFAPLLNGSGPSLRDRNIQAPGCSSFSPTAKENKTRRNRVQVSNTH